MKQYFQDTNLNYANDWVDEVQIGREVVDHRGACEMRHWDHHLYLSVRECAFS